MGWKKAHRARIKGRKRARKSPRGPRRARLRAGRAMEHQRPNWLEVRAVVPSDWAELCAHALGQALGGGTALGRPSLGAPEPQAGTEVVRAFVPAPRDEAALRAQVEALFERLARTTADPAWALARLEFRAVPAEDYAQSWRRDFRRFRMGRLLVLAPGDRHCPRAHERVLELEPGGAFGTGRHATTRGCLRALGALVAPGERVLDAGTGSGILAVAARLLGARECFGFDNDPMALPYALDLARRNAVADRCAFEMGGFELLRRRPAQSFDGALANLYRDVLLEHADDLARALAPNAWFVVSGVQNSARAQVIGALAAAGLEVQATHARGRWDCHWGRKILPGPRAVRGS